MLLLFSLLDRLPCYLWMHKQQPEKAKEADYGVSLPSGISCLDDASIFLHFSLTASSRRFKSKLFFFFVIIIDQKHLNANFMIHGGSEEEWIVGSIWWIKKNPINDLQKWKSIITHTWTFPLPFSFHLALTCFTPLYCHSPFSLNVCLGDFVSWKYCGILLLHKKRNEISYRKIRLKTIVLKRNG